MPSAGELIRGERIKRNHSLSDIAAETRIGMRYLEAIESDDIGTLPGDFFHRSYIRQYARALRLDQADVRRILQAVAPVPEIDPMPALDLPNQIAEVERQAKPLARIPARVAATLLVITAFGCSGLYALWSRTQDSGDPAFRITPAPVVEAPSQPAEQDRDAFPAGETPRSLSRTKGD